MRKHSAMMLLVVLLVSVVSLTHQAQLANALSTQSTSSSKGSFTTDRGTYVEINTTLEHEGGSSITLLTNKPYTFTIQIMLGKLGNDTKDIHDLELTVEMQTSAILGSGHNIFNSYHYDPTTKMTSANATKTYTIPVLVSGSFDNQDANLKVTFKCKEAVDNRPDPSTEFNNIGYNVVINNNPDTNSVTFSGNTTDDRSQEPLTDKLTKINMDVNLTHSGLIDGKPSIDSGNYYLARVNVTLLELGPDASDIHDVELSVLMEDSSITDVLPGNSPVDYYSAYATNSTKLDAAGQSMIFDFVYSAFTNLNNTNVQFKFELKFKEAIANAIDPTSKYNIIYEIGINKDVQGLSSSSGAPFSFGSFLLFFAVLVPIYNKKRNQKSLQFY